MLTTQDSAEVSRDDWDPTTHTPLENAMVGAIKVLLIHAVDSSIEREEFKRSFPLLWGKS